MLPGMKFLLPLILFTSPIVAEMGMPPEFALNSNKEIVINNRILLRVDGKTISLMDVVKKMDMLFFRSYPEYASSTELRFQYYQMHWKTILNSVIDDHLIMADATDKKVEVTEGDIRESMEELFGPDVVVNLEQMGLSFSEARELIKTELTVRRMVGMFVRTKAQCDVHPKAVKEMFSRLVKKAPLDEKWVYRTLTIQTKEEETAKSLAQKALDLLSQKVAFEDLAAHLKKDETAEIDIRLSEEFQRGEKELSLQHKSALATLSVGACSAPQIQISKKDGSHIVRLFHLKEKEKVKAPSLQEMEEKLHAELMDKAVAKYNEAYTEKLRNHYGITENYLETMIPGNYQPFALK